GGQLVVDEAPDPTPGPGQLLVRTLACGICGSDLHALAHGDQMVAMSAMVASPDDPLPLAVMDLDADVVMGHEFVGEVVEVGAGGWNCSVGNTVVSVPMVMDSDGEAHTVGYSNVFPGGYGQLMVLSDPLALRVPNGLDPHLAALTEPMAVGRHAAERSGIAAGEAAVVFGCGPIGLAVVADLRRRGIEPIVAADLSPKRRALATTMGAHEVVDPRDEPAIEAWRRVDSRHATRPVVIFEAVGVPGMIDAAIVAAPRRSRVLVVGVCMEPDTIRPMIAVGRELTVGFALGYEPAEFADTLRSIAEGELDVTPLITAKVGVDGVPDAFRALADPEVHAKILVVP
ncbi:MAG: zinc-binding dehydrogenase, partial [Acidimicrobiales bacterium]